MTQARTFQSASPEETRLLGELVGRAAEAGDVVLLSGELGAGKTVFVQGIGRGLGYKGSVSSKSFVILGEYPGRVKLYHADLYRLEDPLEVEDLALAEITPDGALAVEWPERGDWALPGDDLHVRFEVARDDVRTLTVTPRTERGEKLAAAMEEA
jgi:tRNA threonylcarbamoyladenosine biosynthesis protein TsaE